MSEKTGKKLFMSRHFIGGRSQVVPCELRRLAPGDRDEAVRLHYRATHGLSREIFVPTEERDLVRLLGGDGVSIGVWYEDRLICMRAVMTDGEWVNEMLSHMDFPPDGERRTAYTDHCIVDRDFRGNNVQFLTHYAIENVMEDRFEMFLTTVSPKNTFSLQNILGCNFVIVGVKNLYGGYVRYIMQKKLTRNMPIWTHGHLVIPISDIKNQREALDDGFVGYKMIRKNRGFSVLYAPMAERPPKGYWKNMAAGSSAK
ncbi:MAG: hypothetical protein LBQ36_09960 [Synergistaceae bacterium]|jgi:hypothetical protein|nr:hypothetical protein [Synergistaceae bacterium]